MTQDLQQVFDAFVGGTSAAEAFERQLLMLCKVTPDSAWSVLALLDQYHRRRKLSAEQYRKLRHKIERQALGIEDYPIREPARPAAPPAAAESAPQVAAVQIARALPARARWQRRFKATPALALIAVVVGVAASPAVREVPRASAAVTSPQPDPDPAPPAMSPERTPQLISLTSDRFIVHARQRVAEVTVQRSAKDGDDANFIWWTQESGAKPDQDYVAGVPKRASIVAGADSATLYVPIIANPARHHIEMFYVMIGRSTGSANIGPIQRAAVFILPPDSPSQ